MEFSHLDKEGNAVMVDVSSKPKMRRTAWSACSDKTGIEMEALTAVSAAVFTVYDMCKAVDKKMQIGNIKLPEKTKKIIRAV